MTNYRRNFVPDGSYFFTVNLADRTSRLLTDHIDLLRTAFRNVRVRQAFTIDAIVILPDHLHAIWSLPEGDADFAKRWRHVKAMFSRASPTRERISESRLRGRARHMATALLGAQPCAMSAISHDTSTTFISIP
jgi:putative transposase